MLDEKQRPSGDSEIMPDVIRGRDRDLDQPVVGVRLPGAKQPTPLSIAQAAHLFEGLFQALAPDAKLRAVLVRTELRPDAGRAP
jgi:hypothetical protein